MARLEPYAGGVLVFGRHVYGEAAQLWPKWHTGVWWLASPEAELEPMRRHDCEQIHDVLTLGQTSYWLCRNGDLGAAGFWVVLAETDGVTRTSALEGNPAWLRLGSHADAPLLVSATTVYGLRAGAWTPVWEHDQPWFPSDAGVPRQVGDQLYFMTGLLVGDDLARVDLSGPRPESPLEDVCWPMLRDYYGRWSNLCYMIAPSQTGGLWLTAGHRFYATLLQLGEPAPKLAVFEGSLDRPAVYREDGLLVHAELEDAEFRPQIPATAVREHDGALILAGELGISIVRAGVVEPIVRFDAVLRQARVDVAARRLGARGSSRCSRPPTRAPARASRSPSTSSRSSSLSPDGYTLRWPERPAH